MLLLLVERSQKAHNSPGLTCKELKKEVHQARLLNYQHYTQQERCGHHGESSWEPISEMFVLDTQQVTVICVQVQKTFSFFHTVGFADLNSSDFFSQARYQMLANLQAEFWRRTKHMENGIFSNLFWFWTTFENL